MVAGGYRKIADLPQVIPVFPLDGALLLPGATLPLQIFEPRYLNMVDDVMAGDRLIGMVQTKAGGDRARPRLARVGCAGRITSYAETGDGRYLITLTGVCRFEVGEELPTPTPYRQVKASYGCFEADLAEDGDVEFERAPFLTVLRRYLDHRGLGIEWDAVNAAPAPALINSLCMALPFDVAEKQALLEAPGLEERRAALAALLEIDSILDATDDDDEPPSLQ
ncbi:MAG TPA: LON peptidase substrate-binding domain-containing protein [Caulobacteraceae bacterium]|nr:LON peptidase substrate-binding domain-containing protein [Caulobacteraceae bacterium]